MEQIRLKNGVRIYLEQLPFFRSASFGVWVANGSRHEAAAQSGASHFIEHMLFKGTQTRRSIDIAVQSDLFGGNINAYTAKEYTCIYAHTLGDHVPDAFALLCDMLTNSKFDEQDTDTERGVILDEIAMYEDSAEDLAADLLYGGIWPGSSLGRPILGSPDSVRSFTGESLRTFMQRHYTAGAIVLSICGNFDRDAFLKLAEDSFASLPALPPPPLMEPSPKAHNGISLLERDFEQTAVAIGFPAFAIDDPRRFALSVFSNIAGANASSRLFQRLREELGLAYSVYSYSSSHPDTGLFGVSLTVTPDCEQKALEETIAILRGLCENITDEELYRSKEQLKAGIAIGLEGTASRAANAARGALLENVVRSEDDLIRIVDTITTADVCDVARSVIDFNTLFIAVVGRVKPQEFYSGLF